MGLFNWLSKSQSGTEEKKELPWNNLDTAAQLDDIKVKSSVRPQLIFKYSTRCGINKFVMNEFVKGFDFSEEDFDLYYLDILNHRDISNQIAYDFQVIHESPQLLVIKNGNVIAHASHGGINSLALNQFV